MESAITQELPIKTIEAKNQGRRIVIIETGQYTFYFKKPIFSELAFLHDNLHKSEGQALVQEKFLRSLYVGDDNILFHEYLKEKPLAIGPLLTKICENLGAEENFSSREI